MSKHRSKTPAKPTNRLNAEDQTAINPFPQQNDPFLSESNFVPSYEDIQTRAYQLYEQKGGNELENWMEAERILKQERTAA